MNEKPTHLDLFSGIGGFSLAFEREGFRTIGFSEIDSYASAVLRKHWPNVHNYGDIRNIKGVSADVITGGFPCQPFSVAGKQRGKEDNRYLWPEMLRVIKEVRPTFVVGENVAGIVILELDNCLSDLESIGYTALPFIVPACAVGAAHRRDRVWIIAHANLNYGRIQSFSWKELKNKANTGNDGSAQSMANSDMPGQSRWQKRQRKKQIRRDCSRFNWPISKPSICRGDDGFPNRSHRLKCLGNAIVPQVAQVIAKAIFERMKL